MSANGREFQHSHPTRWLRHLARRAVYRAQIGSSLCSGCSAELSGRIRALGRDEAHAIALVLEREVREVLKATLLAFFGCEWRRTVRDRRGDNRTSWVRLEVDVGIEKRCERRRAPDQLR